MPFIASYLLKLSISLCVVYLFYAIVLRRLTFYTWNRWYLLGYSFLAFLIPFVNISPVLKNNQLDGHALLELIPVFVKFSPGGPGETSQGFAWWSLLMVGALVGILIMLIRFTIRYISFQRIRRSAQLMVDGGVKVYHVDKSIIPFSFGNAIFINPQLHSEEDLRQIVHHEFIHVKQKHTIDILWSELMCMLNWYNPFAWLIRKAIRQNLEFIADHQVLENGVDKKHYQYLLLKVTGAAHFSITQQFNFSSLKKRIVMMNRSRSAKIQLTRFLFLLPLLTVLLLAFRQNVSQQEKPAKTDAKEALFQLKHMLSVQSPIAIDTTPKFVPQDNWQQTFLAENPKVKTVSVEYVRNENDVLPTIVLTRHDGIVEKYDWNVSSAREEFKQRYKQVPPYKTMQLRGRPIADTLIDASLNGPGNPNRKPALNNVLLIVDGEIKEGADKFNELDPDNIESMTVLKSDAAEKLYGEKVKGKEGVIAVTTRGKSKVEKKQTTGILLKADSFFFHDSPQPVNIRQSKSSLNEVLYIINGVEYSAEEFRKLELEPGRIESVEVIKDESATKLYGEKGRNGVIIIKLKPEITLRLEPSKDAGQ